VYKEDGTEVEGTFTKRRAVTSFLVIFLHLHQLPLSSFLSPFFPSFSAG